jgi:AraC-like DNA-binding protein
MVGIRCLALSALAEAEHCDGVPTVLTEAAIANRGTETQLDDIARRLDACVDALQGDIRQPKRGTGAAAAPLPAALSPSRSVASVASAAGVSARTLQRRVLRETGVTPKRLMALQRFSDAARDVALSARSIADIALDAGYADQAHLTTEFNRHAATSPGRLRAEADRIVLTDSVRFFKDPVLRSRVRLLITDHP